MNVVNFFQTVFPAVYDDEKKGEPKQVFSLEELRSVLNHKFWKNLKEGTPLANLLFALPKSEREKEYNFSKCDHSAGIKKKFAFVVMKNIKDEVTKNMENLISVHSLLCLGFLWCGGDNKDKA